MANFKNSDAQLYTKEAAQLARDSYFPILESLLDIPNAVYDSYENGISYAKSMFRIIETKKNDKINELWGHISELEETNDEIKLTVCNSRRLHKCAKYLLNILCAQGSIQILELRSGAGVATSEIH